MLERRGKAPAGGRVLHALELECGALRDQLSAASSRARPQVDHVIGAANGLLVMLDHHQGIALAAQALEGIEKRYIVARVQSDRGLIEHIAHALQIGAELRREPDALRLAAGQASSPRG